VAPESRTGVDANTRHIFIAAVYQKGSWDGVVLMNLLSGENCVFHGAPRVALLIATYFVSRRFDIAIRDLVNVLLRKACLVRKSQFESVG
jgi:hypothetical protein